MSLTQAVNAGGSTTVSVPQPATTLEPPGGPFIRYSQPGYRPQYTSSANAFAANITNPLIAVTGYVARFRARIQASGGVNGSTTVAAANDAPFNVVQQVMLNDANGNPIIVGPGYEMLYLVPKYSGGYGLLSAGDITNMPSYSAISAGSTGTGNFTFRTALPLEFSKGYGLLGMANSSVLPQLFWNLNTSASVYTTAPGTLPTVTVDVGAEFYWLPQGVNIAPPGLGTSRQWIFNKGNPTIPGSSSYQQVQFPRPGGYLDTIILVLRDSTGARQDYWPDPLTLWIDGVPVINQQPLSSIYDDMYNWTGGQTRPGGVIAFTRKTSMSQLNLGFLDTGEQYLSSNPGTLIEVGGTWGSSSSNTPWTLTIITGSVVAAEALIQGLPEA